MDADDARGPSSPPSCPVPSGMYANRDTGDFSIALLIALERFVARTPLRPPIDAALRFVAGVSRAAVPSASLVRRAVGSLSLPLSLSLSLWRLARAVGMWSTPPSLSLLLVWVVVRAGGGVGFGLGASPAGPAFVPAPFAALFAVNALEVVALLNGGPPEVLVAVLDRLLRVVAAPSCCRLFSRKR